MCDKLKCNVEIVLKSIIIIMTVLLQYYQAWNYNTNRNIM